MTSPGCVPGATRTSTSPSSVGALKLAPSAACGAETSSDGDEVVAVAQEALVGGDADEDVEVAGRAAALARVPAAAEADALAVGDALGHVDAQRPAAHLAPAAVALLARLRGDLALAAGRRRTPSGA